MRKIFMLLLVLSSLILCGCNTVTDSNDIGKKNQFYIHGQLPNIGRYSSKINNGRYFEELTYEFVPSSEYKYIVPFIGDSKEFEAEYDPGFTAQVEYYFGMCTLDGKIIMDAGKYSSVNLNTSPDGFSYYILTCMKDGNFEYGYTQTVIPLDGSFALELGQNDWIGFVSDGVISVDDYETADGKSFTNHKFYDYNGKFLFELTPKNETTYFIISAFKSGLALVIEREQISYEDFIKNCYYVDKTGKIVLTGFADATGFNEKGYAGASLDGLNYGIIDTNGNFVIKPEYSQITEVYESKACSFRCVKNGKTVYLTDDLQEFCTVDTDEHMYIVGDTKETARGQYYKNGKDYCVRLSDGKHVYNEEYQVSPNNIGLSDKYFVYTDYSNKKSVIMDFDGKTVCCIDGLSYISEIIEDKGLAVCQYSYETQIGDEIRYDNKVFIYDFINDKEVCSFLDADYGSVLNDNYVAINFYQDSQRSVVFPEPLQVLYDIENNKIVKENLTRVLTFDISGKQYYLTADKQKFCLYDENFNVVVLQNNDMNS